MLNRLFRFLARSPEPDTPPIVEEDEPSVDLLALEAFTRLITQQLGAEESARLARHVAAHGDEFLTAIGEDESESLGHWLLQVDWKAYDEVEWQANLMLAAHGVDERWSWPLPQEVAQHRVITAFKSLQHWLEPRGFTLLHIDSGGDDYNAVIVRQQDADEAVRQGVAAGVTVMSHPDFLFSQNESDSDPFQRD